MQQRLRGLLLILPLLSGMLACADGPQCLVGCSHMVTFDLAAPAAGERFEIRADPGSLRSVCQRSDGTDAGATMTCQDSSQPWRLGPRFTPDGALESVVWRDPPKGTLSFGLSVDDNPVIERTFTYEPKTAFTQCNTQCYAPETFTIE